MQAMMQSSTATSLFSTYASLTGSIMLIRTMVDQLIPRPVRAYLVTAISYLLRHLLPIKNKKLTLVIEPQVGLVRNEVYEAAEVYLGNLIGPNVDKLKVGKIAKQKHFSLTIEKDQEVDDRFKHVDLTWKVVSVTSDSQNGKNGKEKIVFQLSFDKNFKDMVMNEYLPYVLSEAKLTDETNKAVKLFTRSLSGRDGHGGWGCVILDHPATFDTMAMNSDLKKSIIQDLDKFLKRREFYRRVGKAWKRGYLLYGPPGTGKSSLIAAIANYLKFDVYDIELTTLHSDSELRRLLLSTSNRSIIVIEDIDCSANLQKRAYPMPRFPRSIHETDEEPKVSKLSLSGMLNFADGLWSSCGEERIIIFTTNHKDKIDPALLRPGRMDMHIHMSYCTYESFSILASRYLGEFDSESLMEEIERLIENVEVTPAEIAEELLTSEDADLALQGVLDLLNLKKVEGKATKRNNLRKVEIEATKSYEKASTSPQLSMDEIGNDGLNLGGVPLAHMT